MYFKILFIIEAFTSWICIKLSLSQHPSICSDNIKLLALRITLWQWNISLSQCITRLVSCLLHTEDKPVNSSSVSLFKWSGIPIWLISSIMMVLKIISFTNPTVSQDRDHQVSNKMWKVTISNVLQTISTLILTANFPHYLVWWVGELTDRTDMRSNDIIGFSCLHYRPVSYAACNTGLLLAVTNPVRHISQ